MGVVDYFRLPKQQWYWYRNAYNNIPPDKLSEKGIPAAIRLTATKTTIESSDGTDNVQVIAIFVDKDGNPISNFPDVKLEIVSGLGEFLTGSSILFQESSDITIKDGKAAIEFRSYYAGKTVIRDTSQGLKSGELTLFSEGSPKYTAGKTQSISRPYVRYSTQVKKQEEASINLLAEQPTRVSSSAEGHSPRLANDGDLSTYWQSDEKSGGNAWWQVDMENIYSLSQVQLTFREETNARYTIEISMDGTNWNPIVDQSEITKNEKVRIESPVANNRGRFLRVVFKGLSTDKSIHIADIQAFGNHAD